MEPIADHLVYEEHPVQWEPRGGHFYPAQLPVPDLRGSPSLFGP
jgi:hypothetical protein